MSTLTHIKEAILLIGCDNDMGSLPEHKVKWTDSVDWERFDNELSKLNEEQLNILCAGEYYHVDALVKEFDIKDLHDLLNRILDGDLSNDFYW